MEYHATLSILPIFSSDEITDKRFDLVARTSQQGEEDTIDIVLEYRTRSDDALNVFLEFTLPTNLLQPPQSIVSTTTVSYHQ